MNKTKARIIAFYLPQFHPIPENDEWWGKGFTEWTNVGKAKPLFRGHYQPRVPADLGYYDLRLPIVREQQAELAREAGIEGFMYWHYWFGNGKQLMADIFDEVLESGSPDFPFCLGWANHSWYAKNWTPNSVNKDKLLIEQTYRGEADYRLHFDKVIKAFKDSRYIKVDEKPIFSIFDVLHLPDDFIPLWNKWAKEEGFENGIYFVAYAKKSEINSKESVLNKGYSAISYENMSGLYFAKGKIEKLWFWLTGIINRKIYNKPIFTTDYKKSYLYFVGEKDKCEDVIPFMLPNWDHTPRSGIKGSLLINSTPKLFKKHAKQVLEIVNQKKNKLIFLKSWNEWAEGNYMEPDLKFGKGNINALREAIEEIN
jgi:hypothetical protein